MCLPFHSLLRKRGQLARHLNANLAGHNVDYMFYYFLFLRHQSAQIGPNQYEPVDRVEVAKLLGTPDSNKAEKKIEHVSPSANCEYAVVNKKDKKVSSELSMLKTFIRTLGCGPGVFLFSFF